MVMKTSLRMSKLICLALAISMLTSQPASAASPMPPQVPSADEMDRLRKQLDETSKDLRTAQVNLDRVTAEFERAHDQLGVIQGQVFEAQSRLAVLDAELQAAQAAINKRADVAFRRGRVALIDVLLKAKTLTHFLTALGLVRSALNGDSKALMRVRELKAEATRARAELELKKTEQQNLIRDLARKQDQVEVSLRALASEFKKVEAEIQKRKSAFAFPVKAPYSYSDSWGAPRMEGTSYYHSHEGTDIFALKGTPVVATVDGVVENVGTAALGGIKLWVRSPGDNWTYYYAHLSSYAPGITSGVQVRKGDVLGYVGNTGNAQGTPPHLHFETHVPSGAPTNPYPILRRVDPLAR